MCRRGGACGDGGCADGVWKGRGIGRVCRTGGVFGMTSGVPGRGCVWKSEERAGVVVRREVSHGGGQAGCRMPGPEMGHGVRAGPERPARSAELSWKGSRGGAAQLLPGFRTALLRQVSGGHGGGLFTCGGRCCGRRGLLYLQRVLRAGGLYRIASLHSTYISCRFGFSILAAAVSRQPHMCGTKAGKADFRLWPNPLFLLFVYLRYFCRDTAPATGSNSS